MWKKSTCKFTSWWNYPWKVGQMSNFWEVAGTFWTGGPKFSFGVDEVLSWSRGRGCFSGDLLYELETKITVWISLGGTWWCIKTFFCHMEHQKHDGNKCFIQSLMSKENSTINERRKTVMEWEFWDHRGRFLMKCMGKVHKSTCISWFHIRKRCL